jgi:putative peptide zinc metalloprotease protein
MSEKQRQVATDIGGIIDQVYFEGGEFVAEGALIAKLSTEDYRSQVNVLKAELTAIDAKVTSTKARPKAENIEVSKQSLVVAQTQMQYSQDELERNEILFNSGTISQEKFAAYQRAASVDAKQYEKAKAEVQAASVGATKEQVSAVEAEKAPIIAEIQKLQNKIDRSVLKAPFAGRLTTLYLKEQEGRFLDRGQALSTIEDTRRFKVDLQIPETDLQYVKEGSIVNIKMNAYPDTLIKGKVKMLDSGVDGTKGVSIIKAIVYVENPPVELRSGMTGYARVESETLTLWEVLTKSLYRFVTVELWAWLP